MVGQICLEDYLKQIDRKGFDIRNYIPIGSQNAVTRKQLKIQTGLNDRTIRDLIHYARRDTVIINMQDGKGYFIPDMNCEQDRYKLKRYMQQEDSRLKSHGWALKAARKMFKDYGEVTN